MVQPIGARETGTTPTVLPVVPVDRFPPRVLRHMNGRPNSNVFENTYHSRSTPSGAIVRQVGIATQEEMAMDSEVRLNIPGSGRQQIISVESIRSGQHHIEFMALENGTLAARITSGSGDTDDTVFIWAYPVTAPGQLHNLSAQSTGILESLMRVAYGGNVVNFSGQYDPRFLLQRANANLPANNRIPVYSMPVVKAPPLVSADAQTTGQAAQVIKNASHSHSSVNMRSATPIVGRQVNQAPAAVEPQVKRKLDGDVDQQYFYPSDINPDWECRLGVPSGNSNNVFHNNAEASAAIRRAYNVTHDPKQILNMAIRDLRQRGATGIFTLSIFDETTQKEIVVFSDEVK